MYNREIELYGQNHEFTIIINLCARKSELLGQGGMPSLRCDALHTLCTHTRFLTEIRSVRQASHCIDVHVTWRLEHSPPCHCRLSSELTPPPHPLPHSPPLSCLLPSSPSPSRGSPSGSCIVGARAASGLKLTLATSSTETASVWCWT